VQPERLFTSYKNKANFPLYIFAEVTFSLRRLKLVRQNGITIQENCGSPMRHFSLRQMNQTRRGLTILPSITDCYSWTTIGTLHLGELDSSFIGMIDTIVASQGRVFVGTWFSTFSGYINRM
jgi:hypothetical protein